MLKRRTKFVALLLAVSLLSFGETFAAEKDDSTQSNTQNEMETREEFRMNRGLIDLNTQFVPEDQWIIGLTGSYSTHKNDNYTLLLVEGIESEGYSVNVTPTLYYAFKDNTAVGVRFKYGRSLLRIDEGNLTIGGDGGADIVVNDFYSLQHSYIGSAVVRQYIPIGTAKRFALFIDMEIEGGGFQSKFANDEPVKGTFTKGYNVGLGVTPGIVAFATNDVAFEISVGMLGVSYTHADQVHNQVYTGTAEFSDMNLKINLLTIGLGVSIYL